MKARKLYVRWKHRRMIRRAWPLWYCERGTYARWVWIWRQYGKATVRTFSGVAEVMGEFDRWLAAQGKAS